MSQQSSKPYIGARDFFPQDMQFRNWMFGVQRQVSELYGYSEYSAPILEPLSLYQVKSSEEIVSEQLYRFTDRGDREVAIRPEMTPTLARMVSGALSQSPRPFRWFSIANFMRYERPGRGRLREFFQLNVDLLGAATADADAEILSLAADILLAYGAAPSMFTVRFSDRRLFNSFFEGHKFPVEKLRAIGRLIDKREKLDPVDFDKQVTEECGADGLVLVKKFLSLDLAGLSAEKTLDPAAVKAVLDLDQALDAHNARASLRFDPGIVRGFDYYTGLIFEINDNHPENNRALFGGGRYDKLVGLFGKEDVPAVGFGMGDVTLENFLRDHNLVPDHLAVRRGCYLTVFDDSTRSETRALARDLRAAGISVEASVETTKKFGRQLEIAEKKGFRLVLIAGRDEFDKGVIRVKNLATGTQEDVIRAGLADYIRNQTK
ncbi:MAG: histidine--tRNA ligase [Spirochaetia bacterium]|nr:histidine--tRNA ligase [Spirochaetia bacterium]